MKKYFVTGIVIVFLLLITTVGVLGYLYNESRKEVKRQTANVENLVKVRNQNLTLTREEFKRSETKWKFKVDSLLKAEKIALNKVKEITLINTVYRDTGSVKIIYKEPVLKPDKSYSIPISTPDENLCWGMKGQILTTDPNAKLQIDLRRANNSSQLLILRSRFLGFLWWKKTGKYKLNSDCGESDFTKITFVKK